MFFSRKKILTVLLVAMVVAAGTLSFASKKGVEGGAVSFTVLKDDSYKQLALDLTGTTSTIPVFKKLAPRLKRGMKIKVERSLLRPNLSDRKLAEYRLCKPYKTIWSLVRKEIGTMTKAETATAARNIQRLSGIVDGSKMVRGQRLFVPEAMLKVTERQLPPFVVYRDYRIEEFSGLKRSAPSSEIPKRLAKKLKVMGLWEYQTEVPDIDMVVIHTTEHGGTPFDNVANYMSKKQLANYLIGPDGGVYEIVPEEYRAYGCGQSLWDGIYGVDHQSINIEIFADTLPGSKHYKGVNDKQYAALRSLLADIYSRRPKIHSGRVVTHRMVALNYKYEMRSRKGDPYEFDWDAAGLPDNSVFVDRDIVMGRAILVDNKRYYDRVTPGQKRAVTLMEAF